jgi:hypothetical protein
MLPGEHAFGQSATKSSRWRRLHARARRDATCHEEIAPLMLMTLITTITGEIGSGFTLKLPCEIVSFLSFPYLSR